MASNQQDSPFLVVEHGQDGLWHVHERRFDTPGVPFNERQDACDYASERARTKKDAMILLRENQKPFAQSRAPEAQGVVSRMLGWIW